MGRYFIRFPKRKLTVESLLEDEERFADFRQYDVTAGLTKLIAQQYAMLPEPAQRALQGLAVYNAPGAAQGREVVTKISA